MEFEIGSSINKQFFLGATSLDNSPRGFNGFIEYLTIDSPYTDAEKPFAKTIIKKKSFSFVAGRDDIADTFITKSEYQDVVTEQGIKSIAFTQDGSRSLQIKDFNLYLEKGFSIKIKFKPDNKQGNPYPRLIEQPGTYLLNYMYEQKMIKFIIYDADKKYIDAAVKFVPDNAFHDIEAVYQPGQNFISIKLDEQNPCVVPLDNLNVVFKENAPVIIGADKLGESQRAYCGLIANVSIAILKENELKTDLRLKATKSVKNKQGEIPIEKVIVENACAWPKLIKMKNGHMLVAIYNKPNHGTSEGDIECWISKNEGDTWEKSGIAAPHETNGNRIHCAIGNAANGEVVIVSSGYTSNYPRGIKGEPFRFFEKAWICRSKDYGLTWTQDKISFPELATPYGHIFYGSDNNMYLAANKYFTDGLHSYIYQSSDNGLSWKKFSSLNDKDTHDETALIHLSNGYWLAAARQYDNGLFLYKSYDNAKTWNYVSRLTGFQHQPGHLLILKNGDLLLSYGNRAGTKKGIEAMISKDKGQNWLEPYRIIEFEGDGGYPNSYERSDGQILTVFYGESTDVCNHYHMGSVLWNINE